MARKLEIILRATGHAELVDENDDILWSSDADEDFRETISDEFLKEDDVDDILAYLNDTGKLTDAESAKFETGEWDVTEESLNDADEDADDGDEDEPEDDGDDEDD